jgi:hypothetical protein
MTYASTSSFNITVAACQTSSRIFAMFGSRLLTTASAILGRPFSNTSGFFLAIYTQSFMILVLPSADLASRISIDNVDMNSAGFELATCRTARRAWAEEEEESFRVDRWNSRRRSSIGSTYDCQVEKPLEQSSIARARCGLDGSCSIRRIASDTAFKTLMRQPYSRYVSKTYVGFIDWYLCNPIPPIIKRACPASSSLVWPGTTGIVSLLLCHYQLSHTMRLMLLDQILQILFRHLVQSRVKEHPGGMLYLRLKVSATRNRPGDWITYDWY